MNRDPYSDPNESNYEAYNIPIYPKFFRKKKEEAKNTSFAQMQECLQVKDVLPRAKSPIWRLPQATDPPFPLHDQNLLAPYRSPSS